MATSTLRLCRRCLKLNQMFSPKIINHQSNRVYATTLPLSNKHTWLPHDQKPNKFVYMYRDVHGLVSLQDQEAAREFIYALSHDERQRLISELQKFGAEQGTDTSNKPTADQLRLICLHQTLPFIGFGFLDNFLMIVAGEYIDAYLGAILGISTMAAAGLGNLISDVAGVGSAHHVETLVAKFGIRTPHLTPSQVDMKITRWTSSMGKIIGIVIGCLLGMCPLFFFDHKHEGGDKKKKDVSDTIDSPAPTKSS